MIPAEELRTWVGLAADDATADTLLTQLEVAAVAQVELTTHQYLGASAEFVDRIVGDGGSRLTLPKTPVTAVASVTESWPVLWPDADPVAVTELVVRSPYLYRTDGYEWAIGAEYVVTYTAGYAADAFPPLYLEAVRKIVAAEYAAQLTTQATATGGGDIKKETLGEYSYELTAASGGSSTSPSAARTTVAEILAQLPRRIRV